LGWSLSGDNEEGLTNYGVDANKLTSQDIDAVLQYMSYIADPKANFYKTDKGLFSEPTAINIEPSVHSPKLSEFLSTLYRCKFIQDFDWTKWHDEADKYRNNPNLLNNADLEVIIKLLTAHVRADRFIDGHLAEIIDSGHLLRILQRLAEIRKERFS
jgi:hypothetical protein